MSSSLLLWKVVLELKLHLRNMMGLQQHPKMLSISTYIWLSFQNCEYLCHSRRQQADHFISSWISEQHQQSITLPNRCMKCSWQQGKCFEHRSSSQCIARISILLGLQGSHQLSLVEACEGSKLHDDKGVGRSYNWLLQHLSQCQTGKAYPKISWIQDELQHNQSRTSP